MLWEEKDKAEEAIWHRRAAHIPGCEAAMRLCGIGRNRGALQLSTLTGERKADMPELTVKRILTNLINSL